MTEVKKTRKPRAKKEEPKKEQPKKEEPKKEKAKKEEAKKEQPKKEETKPKHIKKVDLVDKEHNEIVEKKVKLSKKNNRPCKDNKGNLIYE